VYGSDGQLTLRVRFSPPSADDARYSYMSAVPLQWAAQTLVAFDELLAHCAAVSYSEEQDAGEDLLQPAPEEMPRTTMSSGSLVLEVVTAEPTLWGANTLGLVALLLKQGPEIAGLPHRVRERWYRDAAAAEKAKRSLEALRSSLTPEFGHPPDPPYGLPDSDEYGLQLETPAPAPAPEE
jgi:hypothetical protein